MSLFSVTWYVCVHVYLPERFLTLHANHAFIEVCMYTDVLTNVKCF